MYWRHHPYYREYPVGKKLISLLNFDRFMIMVRLFDYGFSDAKMADWAVDLLSRAMAASTQQLAAVMQRVSGAMRLEAKAIEVFLDDRASIGVVRAANVKPGGLFNCVAVCRQTHDPNVTVHWHRGEQ